MWYEAKQLRVPPCFLKWETPPPEALNHSGLELKPARQVAFCLLVQGLALGGEMGFSENEILKTKVEHKFCGPGHMHWQL
jgi:hypothetical protein